MAPAAPTSAWDVGWYSKTPAPGKGGATFISGHSSLNVRAVFNRLNELAVGDKITLEMGNGQQFTFAVVETDIFSETEANAEMKRMLSTYQEQETLSLVTCFTDDPNAPRMDKRVMLRAVRQ